jgi:hypothetical protein
MNHLILIAIVAVALDGGYELGYRAHVGDLADARAALAEARADRAERQLALAAALAGTDIDGESAPEDEAPETVSCEREEPDAATILSTLGGGR